MVKITENTIIHENEKSENVKRLGKLLSELQDLLIAENHIAVLYGRLNIIVADDNSSILETMLEAHEADEILKSKGQTNH